MSVLEREDELKFRVFCTNIKVLCKKLVPLQENGWPDRTLLYRGQVMFLELKRKGEKPAPLQYFMLDLLTKNGFYAIWSDNLNASKEAILAWKNDVDTKHTI